MLDFMTIYVAKKAKLPIDSKEFELNRVINDI